MGCISLSVFVNVSLLLGGTREDSLALRMGSSDERSINSVARRLRRCLRSVRFFRRDSAKESEEKVEDSVRNSESD